MNLDLFSWIVLGLVSLNICITLALLGVNMYNTMSLKAAMNIPAKMAENVAAALSDIRNLSQTIKEALIEIKSTVVQHQLDDKKDHDHLWQKMGSLEGNLKEWYDHTPGRRKR